MKKNLIPPPKRGGKRIIVSERLMRQRLMRLVKMQVCPNTLARLRQQYAGKNMVAIPPENPSEVIFELHRKSFLGTAVALIKSSEPHYHERTEEDYEILEGALQLFYVCGDKIRWKILEKGASCVIRPGIIHWAFSNGKAVVMVTSKPGWSPNDHHKVDPRFLNFLRKIQE